MFNVVTIATFVLTVLIVHLAYQHITYTNNLVITTAQLILLLVMEFVYNVILLVLLAMLKAQIIVHLVLMADIIIQTNA